MNRFFLAWFRALHSMTRLDLLWHLAWPTLLSFLIWIWVGVSTWAEAASLLLHFVQQWPFVGSWFVEGSAYALMLAGFAHILLILMLVPLSLLTASVLISVFAVPIMLDRVARSDYPELAERRGGSQIGSLVNALSAVVLFVLVGVLSLPLWLIPGVGVLVSIALPAWLNQRCYRYDALMRHADAEEMQTLQQQHGTTLYALGMLAGVLVYVPVLNLFVPALTGLAFVHYLLQALRDKRGMVEIV